MPEELYVVNTTIEPSFLDICVQAEFPERGLQAHADFINKVREHYAGFNIPYLALFQEERFQVPDNFQPGGGLMSGIFNGMIPQGERDGQDCTLDRYIDRLKMADEVIFTNQPITAVVEFSATELYPDAMKSLEKKYNIKRLRVQ